MFIKKNKDKWNRIQQQPAADADQMAEDFTELVNDLGYAKTFYPGSKVTQYVNGQASKIYLSIYKNRKEESNRLVTFWKYDVPLTIRKHHRVIFLMFLIFLVFFAVGYFSSKSDPAFVRQMLGDEYVDKTMENIENNNPFGIYQSGNSFWLWIAIMINNIKVSLFYFFEGIVFGFLSVIAIMKEAVRLGAFYEMFFAKGLGLQFFLAVMIHGTLEIWSIIVSGAAGVVLGMGLLFPGTKKRIDSFKTAAKDGVKIIIGTIPVFMVAAFFEGFVTRHYKMHWIFSSSILFASLAFIIWYFIVYPVRLQKKLSLVQEEEV